ncbi:HAMP domain-containing protein [Haloarchaeobius iranensis]|uniref:histidine kinase n=1 Tax=Haloarchaeobius iranensis TaxID=996166 RepID=A0A1G9U105_9EURY|nr:cache domain-containing protein [Haloarchaeobius iranensis]SDM53626.1 Signal transduction histidine kinase [Haloarchaeobius iranensis]
MTGDDDGGDGLRARLHGSYSVQLAVTLALVVCVFAGVGWLTVGTTGGVVESGVENTMVSQTVVESENLARWLDANRQFTRVVSEHPALASDDPSEAAAYLDDVSNDDESTDIVGIYVVESSDNVVFASGGNSTVRPPPRSELGLFGRYDATTVTGPYERDGRRVVAFASPVPETVGRVLVVVVATDAVNELFQDPYGDGVTTVVNSDGVVQFSDDDRATGESYLGGGTATSAVVAQGTAGKTGFDDSFRREDEMSGDYVRAYAPVAGTDWVLVKHAPTDSAYAVVDQVRRGIVGVVVVAILASVLVVGFFGWQTGRTVRRLATAAESIAGGDYDTDTTVERTDEFGTLGRSLGEMRDELVARLDATREAERQLRTIVNNAPTTLLAFDADGVVTVEEGRRADDLFEDEAVGRTVFELLEDRPELLESCRTALAGKAVETTAEARGRTYDVRFNPVGDGVEQVLVVAHDVTERRTRRQRIEVLNRILRHDIRNRLNVILGHAEAIAGRTDDEADAEAARIVAAEARRILELSEKARRTQAVVETETEPVPIDELLAEGLEPTTDSVPQLSLTTTLPDGVWARATSDLADAVAELVADAVARNPERDELSVVVSAEATVDKVVIRVDDDGQSLSTAERRALESGSESPLEHASGLGLWLAYWTVTLGGGELAFADSDLGGTCVELHYDRAERPRPEDAHGSVHGA